MTVPLVCIPYFQLLLGAIGSNKSNIIRYCIFHYRIEDMFMIEECMFLSDLYNS
jgi:hypothetical protein